MALFPTVGRQQPKLRIAWWALWAFLLVGVLLHLFPFYFMIITSLKHSVEVLSMPPRLWPQNMTFAAWGLIFEATTAGRDSPVVQNLLGEPFYIYFRNSLFIAFMTLGLTLPIVSLAAYANSKLQRGPAARWTFLFFIGTMMLPFVVMLIPSFLLTRNFPFAFPQVPTIPGTSIEFPTIQLWDTAWAVILPFVFNAFLFLLFKGFFDTIPNSVIQAARVDGGTEFNIFRRIVLPMSIPVYAVAAWIHFSLVWDNFLWQLIVLQSPDRLTTAVAIYDMMNAFIAGGTTDAGQAFGASQAMQQVLQAGLSWNGLMVLGLLQTLPIFIMFIICREYLMKGIRIRGLK